MTNTLIIYYPIISVCAGLSPSIKTKVRPSLLSDHRAEFSAIITDTNYNMGIHLTRYYPRLAKYNACLSTYIVLCKIPLFLGHNLYNTKKYLTKKCYKKALYISNYIYNMQIITIFTRRTKIILANVKYYILTLKRKRKENSYDFNKQNIKVAR